MTLYLLLPVLAFGINLGLTLYAFFGSWRAPGHRILALFLLCMALWGGTLYLMRSSPTLEDAYFWDRWVVVAIAATAVLYLHFTYRFAGLRPARWVLPLAYAWLAIAAALTVAGFVVNGMQLRPYGYAPRFGIAFLPFMAFTYFIVFTGFFYVLHTTRSAFSVSLSNRASYLLVGTVCSLVGATTDILAAQGLPMFPLGNVGNILFAILSTLSILHERLIDIRRVFLSFVSYGLFVLVTVSVYLLALAASEILRPESVTAPMLAITIPAVMVIALGSPYLLAHIRQLTERGFYRQRYEALKALEQFSQQVKDTSDLKFLAGYLASKVRAVTGAQYVALLQPDGARTAFILTGLEGTDLPFQVTVGQGNLLMDRIAREDRVLTGFEATAFPEWQVLLPGEKALLERADVRLYVPVKIKGKLTGLLLLGPRANQGSYHQEDLDMLKAVANQTATAMENARLYLELQQQLQRVAEAQAQVVQSAKLASVGLLAAGVAHEVNNPIFAIQGRAEMLLDEHKGHLATDKAREYVSVIFEMSQRVATVVRDLLAFSRREDGFAPLDLNETLEHAVRLVEPELQHANIQLKKEYAEGLSPILGNRSQLQQVLLNLMFNAKDAMPEGGYLTLRTRARNGHVLVFCSDTGVGIPPQQLGLVFDPFFTTKDVGKGVGLGLYVCQRIVEEHHGHIEVESAPGRGTTFIVTLPLAVGEEGGRQGAG